MKIKQKIDILNLKLTKTKKGPHSGRAYYACTGITVEQLIKLYGKNLIESWLLAKLNVELRKIFYELADENDRVDTSIFMNNVASLGQKGETISDLLERLDEAIESSDIKSAQALSHLINAKRRTRKPSC